MIVAKKIVLKNVHAGLPEESDFEIVEEELPEITSGEFLCKAVYLTVDPYMRIFLSRMTVGTMMMGTQVAQIVESLNEQFPVGKYVIGHFGWRTHTITTGDTSQTSEQENNIYVLPDLNRLPMSLYLGTLGMTGNSAYFGFLEICQPKAGETVVITGAGGAVGSHVGQIAKLKGCTVIGITGSDEKNKWLKSIGFDYTINYKTVPNLSVALAEAAPYGIDCYFDNVGGEISSTIMKNMARFGRVSVCGSISSYNSDASCIPKVTLLQPTIVLNELKIEGFIVNRFNGRWMEGIKQNLQWLKEGKIKYRETIYEGFESMPKAFIGLFTGENIGKAVIKM